MKNYFTYVNQHQHVVKLLLLIGLLNNTHVLLLQLYKKHWLLYVSVHANTIPAGQLVTSMHAQMKHVL